MNTPSEALKQLMAIVREHPAFPELVAHMPKPLLPEFKASEAGDAEKARAKWIFQSGRRTQHDAFMFFLTGEVPQPGE